MRRNLVLIIIAPLSVKLATLSERFQGIYIVRTPLAFCAVTGMLRLSLNVEFKRSKA